MLAYLEHFRAANVEDKDCQKELFDTFVKAVYLYDDHITLTFDINDGTTEDVEISMDDVEQSLCENVRLNSVVGHQKRTGAQLCSCTFFTPCS